MKWMIASDIHGSAFYCRKLKEAFTRERADRLLLLGDLLYHGPRNDLPEEYDPKQVISLLNAWGAPVFAVRGNCDAEVDQMVLHFPLMADTCLLSTGERMVVATHGHLFNETALPPLGDGDILLNGHTHVPACTRHETYYYFNPGSVSLPKEGSRHGYMLFEEHCFTWKDLDGRQQMNCVL